MYMHGMVTMSSEHYLGVELVVSGMTTILPVGPPVVLFV